MYNAKKRPSKEDLFQTTIVYYFFMNPKIEEIAPNEEPIKNKINPKPYENIPPPSPMSRNHFIEINNNNPEKINVPIEAKCFLFAKNENNPIKTANTKIIIATVELDSSPADQSEDICSTISFPEIIGNIVETITNTIAPNPIIVFFLIIFKVLLRAKNREASANDQIFVNFS